MGSRDKIIKGSGNSNCGAKLSGPGLARIIRNPMRKRGIARNSLAYASGYESSLLCLQIDLT